MAKDLQFKAALTEWLAGQSKYKNLREAADGIGLPFNTLRGYFSGKRPSEKNLRLLIGATGVDLHSTRQPAKSKTRNLKSNIYANRLLNELQFDLARWIASIPAVQKALNEAVPGGHQPTSPKTGQQIQILMDALQWCLDAVVNNPEALDLVRRTVSGSDAGYLSGLLGALFDDRRLQTWRQMTTYMYGSK